MIETQNITFEITQQGLSGTLVIPLHNPIETIEQMTKDAYLSIFELLQEYPNLTVIRFWNYVPDILTTLEDGGTLYHLFNAGRFEAFTAFYGDALERMQVPAASAIGSQDNNLTIKFLAVANPIAMIENKDQIPAYRYSKVYGQIPPFFSRGAIYSNQGQRLLISSGTASVIGESSVHLDDIHEQLYQSFMNLRVLGSQPNLKKYNIHYGFTLEDMTTLTVYYKRENDRLYLEKWVPKFISKTCHVLYHQADICRSELLVELEGVFSKKGEYEDKRPKYFLDEDRRIVTESMEIHVTEHCNLKCRDCCNMSPYNPKKFMTLEEAQQICDFAKLHFRPNLFKICGGEPTLHPQIDDILRIMKESKVSDTLKVITNGLLLFKMTDTFWQLIDQLTVSNYISAPIRPKLLEMIKEKAKQFDVMLNIKNVEVFNEIFVEDTTQDKERTQHIYNDCWMRHVCLIIRDGYFHKCTRSSYMDRNLELVGKSTAVGDSTFTSTDGIALADPEFKEKALHYLNSTTPLNSCKHCLGVSGNLRPNIQLKNLRIIES
jgi:organic radical activating enzyme